MHRAACIVGIGLENVRNVPVDEKFLILFFFWFKKIISLKGKINYQRGKMRPDKLEEMIKISLQAKETPFLVALTSGTTG